MKYFKISVLFLLFAFSCKKKDPSSNPFDFSTQITCKINDVSWHPENYHGTYGASNSVYAGFNDSIFSLVGINGYQVLQLNVKSIGGVSTQKYLFNSTVHNNSSSNQSFAAYNSSDGLPNQYITSSKYTGYIQINNIDATNKTVSGTFAFMAYDSTTHDSINVTDGVFNGISYGN